MTMTMTEPSELAKAESEFEAANRRRALAVTKGDAAAERAAIVEMNQIAARRDALNQNAANIRRLMRE